MSSASPAPEITVVVVLYGTSPSTSLALTSLASSLGLHADRFAIEVHDNSPKISLDRTVPGLSMAVDVHHADNPGLALPYNLALEAAERRGSGWLMLLDQDTKVTHAYIDEVVAFVETSATTPDIAVGAPRLHDDRGVLSPHKPVRLRHPRLLVASRVYPHSSSYFYLNSGAVIRVSAARAVGGFPAEYPLDYLDHAMSSRLKRSGYSLFTLESRLEHQLSVRDMPSVPIRRLLSIFRAEERYYSRASRMEAIWLLARRGARALLLILRIHRSTHREAEIEAVWCAIRALIAPRPRRHTAKSALKAQGTVGHQRPKSASKSS